MKLSDSMVKSLRFWANPNRWDVAGEVGGSTNTVVALIKRGLIETRDRNGNYPVTAAGFAWLAANGYAVETSAPVDGTEVEPTNLPGTPDAVKGRTGTVDVSVRPSKVATGETLLIGPYPYLVTAVETEGSQTTITIDTGYRQSLSSGQTVTVRRDVETSAPVADIPTNEPNKPMPTVGTVVEIGGMSYAVESRYSDGTANLINRTTRKGAIAQWRDGAFVFLAEPSNEPCYHCGRIGTLGRDDQTTPFAHECVTRAELIEWELIPANSPATGVVTLPDIPGYYWARHNGHMIVDNDGTAKTTDTYILKVKGGRVAATIRHVAGFRWLPQGSFYIARALCVGWDGIPLADALDRVATYMREIAAYQAEMQAGLPYVASDSMSVGNVTYYGGNVPDGVASDVNRRFTSPPVAINERETWAGTGTNLPADVAGAPMINTVKIKTPVRFSLARGKRKASKRANRARNRGAF